jgi:hypothetical protein
MDRSDWAYWIATGLFCLVMASSAVCHLLRIETIAAAMTALGYPAYVMTVLGTAKLLGIAALVTVFGVLGLGGRSVRCDSCICSGDLSRCFNRGSSKTTSESTHAER